MPYHHVYIRDDSAALRLLMTDQTEGDLVRRVVKPYKRGGALVSDGRIVPISSLREIQIVVSAVPFEEALAAEQNRAWTHSESLNRQGGAVRFGPSIIDQDDLVHVLDDVTGQFLRDTEPGSSLRESMLERITAHPLIANLFSGLIGWAIGFYFGRP